MLTAILFTLFAFGPLAVAPDIKPQTLCGTRYLIAELADSGSLRDWPQSLIATAQALTHDCIAG
jgi:hypothetical protein